MSINRFSWVKYKIIFFKKVSMNRYFLLQFSSRLIRIDYNRKIIQNLMGKSHFLIVFMMDSRLKYEKNTTMWGKTTSFMSNFPYIFIRRKCLQKKCNWKKKQFSGNLIEKFNKSKFANVWCGRTIMDSWSYYFNEYSNHFQSFPSCKYII